MWVGTALIIALTVVVGFSLMLITIMLGSRTNSGLVLKVVSLIISFLVVLVTTVLFLYGRHTTYQVEHYPTGRII